MADAKKITAEELESVQGLVTASREAESNYFKISLEVERLTAMRSSAYATISSSQEALQVEMNKLKEVYGDIVVNLETGEYEDAPAQEEAPMEVVEE
jgi:uncharacterized protein YpbB